MVVGSTSESTAAKRAASQDAMVGRARSGGNNRTRVTSQTGSSAVTTKDYILGDCLGKGAFGSVYRALNLSTGETVAVKRISLADIPQSELGAIMSEIELLKNLKHPSIVKYKGYEMTREYLFIILEYCENGSLQSICKRFGNFPEGLVSIYINQVLEGLQYLHEEGVIHRDIKGANILTNKDGSVKLADFGVAIKAGALAGGSVAGSPYWMAPEVIDQSGAVAASDIWSVGCVIIELLEGQPPYASLDPMPALFRIVQDDCPPLPKGASPMVTDFLLHCFEKDANLRVSAKTLLEHPWMCLARRQLRQMRSNGSIGKAVHDHAVRTVRHYNQSPNHKDRRRPPPLVFDRLRPATAGPLSSGLSSPRSLRRVSGSIAACSSESSSPSSTKASVLTRSPLRTLGTQINPPASVSHAMATTSVMPAPCDRHMTGSLGLTAPPRSASTTRLADGSPHRWPHRYQRTESAASPGRLTGDQREPSQPIQRGSGAFSQQRLYTRGNAIPKSLFDRSSDAATSKQETSRDIATSRSLRSSTSDVSDNENTIKYTCESGKPNRSSHRQDRQRNDAATGARSEAAVSYSNAPSCHPMTSRSAFLAADDDLSAAGVAMPHKQCRNVSPSDSSTLGTALRADWPVTSNPDPFPSPRTSKAVESAAHMSDNRIIIPLDNVSDERSAGSMQPSGLPPHSPVSIPLSTVAVIEKKGRAKRASYNPGGQKRPLSLLTRSLSGSSVSSSSSKVEARGSISRSSVDDVGDRCDGSFTAQTATSAGETRAGDDSSSSSSSPSRDVLIKVLRRWK